MVIDQKLWDDMRHTLTGISMPLVSHQQVQQLLNHVENAATGRTNDSVDAVNSVRTRGNGQSAGEQTFRHDDL
jgi:hypothetical protein